MDELPPHLIHEILSRLNSSLDLARCQLASKTLAAASAEVRSINLLCSFDRYTKSRLPSTKHLTTPFKKIFANLVSRSSHVDSVSIGVERPLGGLSYDDVEDEADDLYLNDVGFVREWLPGVCGRLRSFEVSDFWIQSCWRRSEVLSLISSCCHNLHKLVLKNAWLSADGLNAMPTLTDLTLEFIRLDDEDLGKVNSCFPSLQILNLIGVGGLKEPKIHLLHLRECRWTVSNAPLSLTILAPNLIKLKLECIKPGSLFIDAPLLSDFHLSIEKACNLVVKDFRDLKTLHVESPYLCTLFGQFQHGRSIKNLTVDISKWAESAEMANFNLERLLVAFPNAQYLTLGPGSWLEAGTCFHTGGSEVSVVRTKEITAHLFVKDVEITLSLIFFVLERCPKLTDMALLIHRAVESSVASDLMSRCMARSARVRWRWGFWKEGMKDAWVSDGI
ncbi:F-box/LRR-repeat protein At4g29420 [Rhododendron vialii]|uniref:F-box/LRR-repeat protein At4g29420 n=1 Tax=Rhododendron vialii TaxID=182163 RepID=UPI002660382D|nr:F-box/LRR-repeat protein At4g29420 [Rhododendron vialii]